MYKWAPANLPLGEPCDGLASHSGGVEILLVASYCRNRDKNKLRPDGPLGSNADFFTLLAKPLGTLCFSPSKHKHNVVPSPFLRTMLNVKSPTYLRHLWQFLGFLKYNSGNWRKCQNFYDKFSNVNDQSFSITTQGSLEKRDVFLNFLGRVVAVKKTTNENTKVIILPLRIAMW